MQGRDVWHLLICFLQRPLSFQLGVPLYIHCRSVDRTFCAEEKSFLCSIYILAVPG